MESKLNREFVFVFDYGNNSDEMIEEDMRVLSNMSGKFTFSRYENTISISCQSLSGLSSITSVATASITESEMKFRSSLSRKLIEFIG